ncbi:hypothetical protein B0H16DRAFT_1205380, partial [Mycena metata]
NYLAFVARGLDEATGNQRRGDAFDKHIEGRQAHVLDSLAYVLVSQPRAQVVAVAAELRQDGVGILVAENRPPLPTISLHLNKLFKTLKQIH